MSFRNEAIRLRKKYPNDFDFAKQIDLLLLRSRTCCDLESNHIKKAVEDAGPYGYGGLEIRCKCGKLIDFKFNE